MKIQLDKTGLEGDNLKFVNDLEKRFSELPDVPDHAKLVEDVRSAMKEFYKDGKPTIDIAKLQEMLGEDDKGVRSIMKKLGDEITALKESAKNSEGKKLSFRAAFNQFLDENKDQLRALMEGGPGNELRFDIRAAETMTSTNTITGHSGLPDDLIESFSVGSFVAKRHPREYVFDIANRNTVAKVTKYKTWYEEGTEDGAFAIVAENGVKPLMDHTLVRNHSEVFKAAGKYVVTEEFPKFLTEAYNIIRRLIQNKVLRDYASILTTKLLNDAASYTSSALDGQYANPTDYHAIGAVAAQIEALDFVPDVLILNPQDKWRIGLSQDQQGQFYLTIPITDPSGTTRMMGFIVRTSNRISAGEFILGESGLWEIEDESISIRMGHGIEVTVSNPVTAVSSDFDTNRFRVIAELYAHAYIATPNIGSFVKADFDTVKEALTTPEA